MNDALPSYCSNLGDHDGVNLVVITGPVRLYIVDVFSRGSLPRLPRSVVLDEHRFMKPVHEFLDSHFIPIIV